MADHNPQHGRRPHFNRGRRGPDRRGTERRTPPRDHTPDAAREASRDGIDVEQIMRDIRARIAQRHGIELSNQQIQELAARRLDAILEPRNIKPQLLEQLRRSASTADVPAPPTIETYDFDESSLYQTHRGLLRFFRRILNPILKLFFNPTPLIQALNTQARINKDLAARAVEHEQRQNEWNALHFELLQRMVLETSRLTLELQAMDARIESLSAKVDFNERRVRGLDVSPSAGVRPRPQDPPAASLPVSSVETAPMDPAASSEGSSEGTRRRRRRRRGRRSGPGVAEAPLATGMATALDDNEPDDAEEEELAAEPGAAEPRATRPADQAEPVAMDAPPATVEPSVPAAPTPPRDEPMPQEPVDRADPGPVDR